MHPALPTLSVILIHGRDTGLVEHVRHLAATPIPTGTQIIVASADADADRRAPSPGCPGVDWVVLSEPGASEPALRRAAMRVASGDVVLFATPADAAEKLHRLTRARSALASTREAASRARSAPPAKPPAQASEKARPGLSATPPASNDALPGKRDIE